MSTDIPPDSENLGLQSMTIPTLAVIGEILANCYIIWFLLIDFPMNCARLAAETAGRQTCSMEIGGYVIAAISAMMILSNELAKLDDVPREAWEAAVRMLSPYAPHLAEELWERAGKAPSVCLAVWPAYEEALTRDDTVTIVVQVNGKLRDKFEVPAGTNKEELEHLALARSKTQEWMAGKRINKVITVPDKLVNIVLYS